MFSHSCTVAEPPQLLLDPYILRRGNTVAPASPLRAGAGFIPSLDVQDGWSFVEAMQDGSLCTQEFYSRSSRAQLDAWATPLSPGASADGAAEAESDSIDRTLRAKVMNLRNAKRQILANAESVGKDRPCEAWDRLLKGVGRSIERDIHAPDFSGGARIYSLADIATSETSVKREDDEDDDDAVVESMNMPFTSSFAVPRPLHVAKEGTSESTVGLWHELNQTWMKAQSNMHAPMDSGVHGCQSRGSFSLDQLPSIARRLHPFADSAQNDDEDDQVAKLLALACSEIAIDAALSTALVSRPTNSSIASSSHRNASHHPSEVAPPVQLAFHHLGSTRLGLGPDDEGESDAESDEEQETRRKPSLKSSGLRSILDEWQLGTDPLAYRWSNPYTEDSQMDMLASQTQPQNRRKRARFGEGSSQTINPFSQVPDVPPSITILSSQQAAPPVIASSNLSRMSAHRVGRANIINKQSSSIPFSPLPHRTTMSASQPAAATHGTSSSQPSILVTDSQDDVSMSPSKDMSGAMSQALPGAFGGRQHFKKDKKKSRRQQGF
ncbi:hypothetical protein OIV83_001745 [Microbotryomycetes sp. JL201]|nr:hypothetical protein OIV83_001745 [Microbotryomycetes sp. JL201]